MNGTAKPRKFRRDLDDLALIFLSDRISTLARLWMIPALGALLLSYPLTLFDFGDFIGKILYGIVFAMFAVSVHGVVIKDERPGWLIFRFRSHELAYAAAGLLYILGIHFAVSLGKFLSALLSSNLNSWLLGVKFVVPATPPLMILAALYGAVFFWLFCRLILIFPHAAVTGKLSFSMSWHAMRGNIWPIVWIGGFPPAPVREALWRVGLAATPFHLLSLIVHGSLKYFLQATVAAFGMAFFATITSFAYQDLVKDAETASGAPVRAE